MFEKLFVDNGLSLDRLRALVEVAAAGGMSLASGGDPVRQSQYSRQIKELEDFFDARLIERQGRGIRLTSKGRELALISRFFLLGLSNFQNGCSSKKQVYRVGASATVVECFLIPILAEASSDAVEFVFESVSEDDEIERRLRDLTLDFGIVSKTIMARPLQMKTGKRWQWMLWVPRSLARTEVLAVKAFKEGKIPRAKLLHCDQPILTEGFCLTCDGFVQVRAAIETGSVAGLLPDFMECRGIACWKVAWASGNNASSYSLAWNPRLLRLNPKAGKMRDYLMESIQACH